MRFLAVFLACFSFGLLGCPHDDSPSFAQHIVRAHLPDASVPHAVPSPAPGIGQMVLITWYDDEDYPATVVYPDLDVGGEHYAVLSFATLAGLGSDLVDYNPSGGQGTWRYDESRWPIGLTPAALAADIGSLDDAVDSAFSSVTTWANAHDHDDPLLGQTGVPNQSLADPYP